jgi:hypothetical protein
MDGSSPWTAVGAIATSVAAFVTAVSAVIIALQTRATRKAAEAGEKTAKLAAESLDISRRQQSNTHFLVLEAVKSRIDANLPRITVTTKSQMKWPPLEPSDFGDAQPWRSPDPYRMPRDAQSRLLVRVPVSIANDGPKTVSVAMSPGLVSGREVQTEAILKPGTALAGEFEVNHSISEWVAIWEERERERNGGPETTFTVTYIDPADTGAIEHHRVVFGGTILVPVTNETGAWELLPGPHARVGDVCGIGWSAQPTKRRYFLSRTNNLELPEIELEA